MSSQAKPQEATENPRRRLSPAERQHFILEGAIAYFAEFGFDRATRDLAAHLGISQSLIYRYFPSKSSLIDRIYDVVFINRWNDSWEGTLADRTRALSDRLKDFYRDYNHSINRYEVIRISLYSALRGETISTRYLDRIRSRLIDPIVTEFRHALDLPSPAQRKIELLEQDYVFGLHSTVIYAIIRRHVFNMPVSDDTDFLIDLHVDSFVASAPVAFERILKRENAYR